ncbi:aldose epimerase family protein [Tabrizicola sp.]|uniref:aldose epimerase family protein n=1 Tax=Tabrizicola sp. TaxID=2005166 RepID=UPI00286C07D7|nr:aldose epimerase family protein [Tabrizicola sp.]
MQAMVTGFGMTAAGMAVQRVVIAAGDLTVSLLTLGAALQGVRLRGVPHSLTIGSDDVALYEGAFRHHGTLIGPVVNRLTGAKAPIGGVLHRFKADAGEDTILHSGPAGTHRKVWTLAETSASHAVMTLDLKDGEGGFPGNRQVRVTYSVQAPATLRMAVEVTTDALTLINFANHSYWNIDGSDSWFGHRLQIAADRYLPSTPVFTPTGEIADVAGTEYDFREERVAEKNVPPLDTCFCLADGRRGLTEVLSLTGQSGVRLRLATTEPGVQLYDGWGAGAPGHPAYQGVAIEAQGWPDPAGRAGFPSIELAPGEVYAPVTEWRFDRV